MYLFDARQNVRAVLKDGVTKWLHKEQTYALEAAIDSDYDARPGEYLGFLCVDERWRLFCIDKAEVDDDKGQTYIKATDAAVDDLKHIVTVDAYQEGVTAKEAVQKLIAGTEWALGAVTTDDAKNTTDAQYVALWDALQNVKTVFGVRIEPYYVIEGGEIKAKRIDLLADVPEYRGRFFESRTNASSVVVTYNQRPYTVLYGLGKNTGTGNTAQRVTIADAVWSKANGDPADKPAGQGWVEDVEATAQYGRRERIYLSDQTEDAAELLKLTWEELQKQTKPKATVDAVIRDMEQIKGQRWKAVRLGDKVIVRTARGEDVETRIIGIERDYLYPDQTKLTAGEELPTASNQVASLIRTAIHTQEKLTIYRNNFLHDAALIQLNADTILSNSKEIQIVTEELTLKADKVTLDAYVTITQLEANYAKIADLEATYAKITDLEAANAAISNLTSGLTTASVLKAAIVNGDQINGTYGSFDSLTHNSELVSQRKVTMGDLGTVGKALSTGGELDLQHSHAVTVNESGVLQLGEVSATGGNFNIADTQFYKNGVAAAAGKVYFTSTAWSAGRLTVKISNDKSKVVSLTQGTPSGNNIPVLDADSGETAYTVNATSVYNNGWNACRNAAVSWRVLVNYYASGETLYDADGNVATGPWYKGTEAYRYELPAAL